MLPSVILVLECICSLVRKKLGFSFHHTRDEYLMLTKWLPIDQPNKLPSFATHYIGTRERGGVLQRGEGRGTAEGRGEEYCREERERYCRGERGGVLQRGEGRSTAEGRGEGYCKGERGGVLQRGEGGVLQRGEGRSTAEGRGEEYCRGERGGALQIHVCNL